MYAQLNPVNWKYRRRYLMVVTGFTMLLMGFSVIFRSEHPVSETVVSMGFIGLMGYVGTYVFGAVWDQANTRKSVNASISMGVDPHRVQVDQD